MIAGHWRPIVLAFLVSGLAILPVLAEKSNSSNAILPGGNSKEPINIEAAKLDYFDKAQKLVYSGSVVATQGDSTLKASTLVIFLTSKDPDAATGVPSSSSQVRRMEAAGPVTMISKDQIETGDSGIYIKSENKIYLFGNVTLTQGQNVTKGDKLIYDLTTNQAVVTGRVRSMFLPSNSNEDSKKPSQAESATKADSAK
jgi:lipopolysaccharide export system protein LptA